VNHRTADAADRETPVVTEQMDGECERGITLGSVGERDSILGKWRGEAETGIERERERQKESNVTHLDAYMERGGGGSPVHPPAAHSILTEKTAASPMRLCGATVPVECFCSSLAFVI
jgi:hypothetical protein